LSKFQAGAPSLPAVGYGLLNIFTAIIVSRTALGPTEPPIWWELGPLSLEVICLGHEADHSPPSNAKAKNAWSYTFHGPDTS